MSSRKGKNTGKENKEKDKGVLLWDNQSLREKGKGKRKKKQRKNKEWRVVRDSQSPREKGKGKKTETKELLETVRVQQRRVNGKKSREKTERRELLETKSPREKRKWKKCREEIERKELHALKMWTQSIGKNYRSCERELASSHWPTLFQTLEEEERPIALL